MLKKGYADHLVGTKINKLTILSVNEKVPRTDGRNYKGAMCQCECGFIKKYILSDVTNGHSKSCGCGRPASLMKATTKHNMAYHPIYNVWAGMKQRCCNPNDSNYKNYGGRGIIVFDEWLNNNQLFFQWALNNGWAKGLEIDRINNDGNYEPNNCRFVPRSINATNKRNTIKLLFKGENKSLKDWCVILNLKYSVVLKRIYRGWTVDMALSKTI